MHKIRNTTPTVLMALGPLGLLLGLWCLRKMVKWSFLVLVLRFERPVVPSPAPSTTSTSATTCRTTTRGFSRVHVTFSLFKLAFTCPLLHLGKVSRQFHFVLHWCCKLHFCKFPKEGIVTCEAQNFLNSALSVIADLPHSLLVQCSRLVQLRWQRWAQHEFQHVHANIRQMRCHDIQLAILSGFRLLKFIYTCIFLVNCIDVELSKLFLASARLWVRI